jgi:hypothetical protein
MYGRLALGVDVLFAMREKISPVIVSRNRSDENQTELRETRG